MNHCRIILVFHHVDGEFDGVIERPLEWMARIRAGMKIAFHEDPGGLYKASWLVGLQVDDAWNRESAWLGGLDVEEDDIAARVEER